MQNGSIIKLLGITSIATLFSTAMLSSAAVVSLDLTSNGQAGVDLRDTGSHIFDSITLTGSAISADTGTIIHTLTGGMGVDDDAEGNDNNEIEATFGESLTFTLNFGDNVSSLILTEIDFSSVGGASGGDAALVSINGGANFLLETGATDFSGVSDIWTPTGGISILNTYTITFTSQADISLQGISFDVTATVAPEPSSLALLVFGVLGLVGRNKKKLTLMKA